MIWSVLSSIQKRFYADRDMEFWQQKRHLTKALLRYGHICNERGWEFDNEAIQAELMGILNKITREQFEYLPAYLHEAIGRHVTYRAEELSERAKALPPKVTHLMDGLKPVVLVVKSDVELAAALYRKLNQRKPKPDFRQQALF